MILKEGVYVSDYELLPESPLGGVEIELDGFNITEVTDKSSSDGRSSKRQV